VYGSVLHLQLIVDVFILIFVALLFVWPKGAAVALAAFREGIRQPMFLLVLGLAVLFLTISPVVPYFTFGEDFIMMKELGYDIIMLAAVVFGVLAASMSISEEIEGRTAITLMSKPVSRRQFLLGKFVGLLLASLVLTSLLGWYFDWILIFKRWFDRLEPVAPSATLTAWLETVAPPTGPATELLRGCFTWMFDATEASPGLIFGSCKAMVLLAIAVALATRLPMVLTMVISAAVYFLGHLTTVLVMVGRRVAPGTVVGKMLNFMSVLFDNLLPSLDLFSLGPALVTNNPPPPAEFAWYIASVVFYALLFSAIALLFGLVLFEDRDLA
jgi:hypothetical protein